MKGLSKVRRITTFTPARADIGMAKPPFPRSDHPGRYSAWSNIDAGSGVGIGEKKLKRHLFGPKVSNTARISRDFVNRLVLEPRAKPSVYATRQTQSGHLCDSPKGRFNGDLYVAVEFFQIA